MELSQPQGLEIGVAGSARFSERRGNSSMDSERVSVCRRVPGPAWSPHFLHESDFMATPTFFPASSTAGMLDAVNTIPVTVHPHGTRSVLTLIKLVHGDPIMRRSK